MNEKALRAECASRGVEVSCKQHRQGAKESQAALCSHKKNRLMMNRFFMIQDQLFLFCFVFRYQTFDSVIRV